MAMDFATKVQLYIEEHHMIRKGGHVLAGVSGGADSVCLLLVLHELEKRMGFSLVAVHVEHGIRGEESLADARFAETLCGKLGIPFRLFSIDAPAYAAKTHRSLEEAARELRYGCFASACVELGADCVAVAHHANDNAETMLFHLARGSGIRGLCGISPVVRHQAGDENSMCIIRPLLCATRAEIEEYLNVCGQPYRVDSTNADLSYTRNRIRGRVLPELTEVNAQALAHMTKTAGWLRDICAYLDEAALKDGANVYEVIYDRLPVQTNDLCRESFQERMIPQTRKLDGGDSYKNEAFRPDGKETGFLRIDKIRIFTEPFFSVHRVLGTTLVHRLIGEIAGSKKDITSEHVMQVLALFDMGIGKRTDLPYGISARRTADGVELYHKAERPSVKSGQERMDVCLDLPVPGELLLANNCRIRADVVPFDGNIEKIPKKRYTKWMDYDKIINTFQIRTRRPGDYLQVDARGGHKKLKRYFIDEKIPIGEREDTLLVAEGSHILWVIGHRISEDCKVTKETRHVLCLKYFTEEDDDREN